MVGVGGRGQKWVKPEGNKVQKVQLGPEVPSSPRCLPGSAVTASTGTWSMQGARVVLCVHPRYALGCQRVALKSACHGLLWRKMWCPTLS